MARLGSTRRAFIASLPVLLLAVGPRRVLGRPTAAPATSSGLTVSLAIEQPTVVQPFPARLMLSLRNTSSTALWLYRPLRDAHELARAAASIPDEAGAAANSSSGGAVLEIHLEPAAPSATSPAWAVPPHAKVMVSAGMPRARLVKLAPSGEQAEGAVVELDPGLVTHPGGDVPLWGRYRLWVTYSAIYSNASSLSRDLGADIWQGDAASNSIDVELEPAPASAKGLVSGRVTSERGDALQGILVSLSDSAGHLVAQALTYDQGQYSLGHLPWGRYFVTARRPGATSDTDIYSHADLSDPSSSATLNLVLLDREVEDPKDLVHKPVLIEVRNGVGEPFGGVQIEALWSSGSVAETVKGETDADGSAALDLLPGRIYLTLKHRKCPSQDGRVDVAEGDGIDGSIVQYDCKAR
ncbi:MAG TPA: carboxypeptidase-like regulatory domain-containing protein [Terriglobia bacterium]|nr:carboxypeptidase-like regulatory domain-containing protein [Terriglobia bacterium]